MIATRSKLHRNLFIYSNTLTNAAWTKTATTITANSIANPFGTIDANLILETATTNSHAIDEYAPVTSTIYTVSFFAKNYSSNRWLMVGGGGLASQNIYVHFNPVDGSYSNAAAGTNYVATSKSFGNGWYLFSLTFTASNTSNITIFLKNAVNTSTSYLGSITAGAYIWQPKLEQYNKMRNLGYRINTTSAAVTENGGIWTG